MEWLNIGDIARVKKPCFVCSTQHYQADIDSSFLNASTLLKKVLGEQCKSSRGIFVAISTDIATSMAWLCKVYVSLVYYYWRTHCTMLPSGCGLGTVIHTYR